MLSRWWGRVKDLIAGYKRELRFPPAGKWPLNLGGVWGMMIGRCGGPPRNSAEFIGSRFLAHTQTYPGQGIHPIPSHPVRCLKDPVPPTSSPRPLPARPTPPRNITSLSRRGTERLQSCCCSSTPKSLQWPRLWWSMATRIVDGRVCMSPPSSPGDVSVSQWARGSQRERTQKKNIGPSIAPFFG